MRPILGITLKKQPKKRAADQAKEMIDTLIEEQHALENSWVPHLEPVAEQLSSIPITSQGLSDPPQQAIDAALTAWRLGGEPCMRKLLKMTTERCEPSKRETLSEYITIWWDGIGTWKAEPVLAR